MKVEYIRISRLLVGRWKVKDITMSDDDKEKPSTQSRCFSMTSSEIKNIQKHFENMRMV